MLFSSGVFWVFYSVVLLLIQWNAKRYQSEKIQNIVLLIASYFFYAYWDWRFLGLIIAVSLQTYFLGRLIDRSSQHSKRYLGLSVLINVVILGYFKYFNFFARELLEAFGLQASYTLEHIILPVGISFYIFQSLTYVIDIYFRKLRPEKNVINYFAYIAFFPQLVAGPIERASSLLPQFNKVHSITLDNLYSGIKLCIIGLFLKIFIADNLASNVDFIFGNHQQFRGGTLFLGAIAFTVQIYGDFCGYSLIAIGTAKIIGFELMRNFNTPYFSTSIQDFWRRWHISLSTFFRDYVYIPLGGSRTSHHLLRSRNILVTFVLSGLWHGANWTFIIWGGLHGALLVLQNTVNVVVPRVIGWLGTMVVVVILWILFRSQSIADFYQYTTTIIFNPGRPEIPTQFMVFILYYLIVDLLLLKYREQGQTWFNNDYLEGFILALMLLLVLGTIHQVNPNFIYFQF